MQYSTLEGIRVPASRLVFGTGTRKVFADDPGAAIECLDMVFEAGFTVFDSAHSYEHAEENLGKWLVKRGCREKIILLDKGCNPGQHGMEDTLSAQTILEQFQMSLDRLQTDYIDLYILHRDDPTRPVGEIVEILNKLKEEGKILRFGGSNWTYQRILEANAYAQAHGLTGFTVCSPQYSMVDYVSDPWGGSVSATGEAQAPYRRWLEETQMPVFNYSSLGRGYLSGKYRTNQSESIEKCLWWGPIQEYHSPENVKRLERAEKLAQIKGCTVPQIAVAWLCKQKMNLFPILSPSSQTHIKETVDALQLPMTAEEAAWIINGGSLDNII